MELIDAKAKPNMTAASTIQGNLSETSKMLKANFVPSRVRASLEFPSSRLTDLALEECQLVEHTRAELDYKAELQQALALIANPLCACEKFIADSLVTNSPAVQPMLDYVKTLGGKRLRPALLLLSAQSFGKISEEAIRLAAVVELVHTATLVHDDILDSANFRRHRATMHCKWNVPSAVLVGDWLFTQAYNLANAGDSTLPGRWIAWAAKSVCEGEIAQGASAGNSTIGQDAYIQMLAGKTGALCAISCGLGAWAGGADLATCEKMYDFGMKLGIAFQIHDDWLDIWGDADAIGKGLAADLKGKKWTLPLMRYRDTASEDDAAKLKLLVEADSIDLDAIRVRLGKSDAESFTKQLAQNFIQQALANLDTMGDSPEYLALCRLSNAAIHRTR